MPSLENPPFAINLGALNKDDSHHIGLIYDRIFKDSQGKNAFSFNVFNQIYSIPKIQNTFTVSQEFFEYTKKKEFFITLALYDSHGKIFLMPIQNGGWALPGGSIHEGEHWHESVNRLCKSINPHIKLGEVEPVAIIHNSFKFNNKSHEHKGIGFIARIRNESAIQDYDFNGKFVFLNKEELSHVKAYSNKAIVEECLKKIAKKETKIQEHEISANETYKARYIFHNTFVKRFVLTDRLKRKHEFQKVVLDLIGGAQSVLDASCGDNNLVNKILRINPGINYVVGNDISWSQISMTQDHSNKVIFTNHDAVELPFVNDAFDVVMCSNTLHHMPTRKHLNGLLKSLHKVAKKTIIVEIEKPSATGLFPHLLNKYWYIKFLKDVGGAYLEESDFQKIVRSAYRDSGAEIEFTSFRNIQGRYMIAVIEKKG